MTAKPIMFRPKYEVNDSVYVMIRGTIIKTQITLRIFEDGGEDELESSDKVLMKACKANVIDAKVIRSIDIKYCVESKGSDDKDLVFPEEEIFGDKNELIQYIKELP